MLTRIVYRPFAAEMRTGTSTSPLRIDFPRHIQWRSLTT